MEIVEEAERRELELNTGNVGTRNAVTDEISHEYMDTGKTPEKSPNCLNEDSALHNLSIVPCDILSPTLIVSPRVNTGSRKSLKTTSMLTGSEKNLIEN
ncbi:unnamed protein product [Cuscuta campestris]|uniref:Uncharacterized protein n=1 Tax=Cuscuta campestris TaxID=132261 RepID=A0A484M9F5_9ASTE|nr:unnamed protein product [Cuscuta campestris]